MNKLFRSETDKMLGGVCGGLAQNLEIDSSIVRLLFLLISITGGSGLLIYIVCWVIIPSESDININSDDVIEKNAQEIKNTVSKTAKGFKTEVKSDTNKEDNNAK